MSGRVVYALHPIERSRRRSRSCFGGHGPVLDSHQPRHSDGGLLEHLLTLDLADVPELAARFPDAAVLSFYVVDVANHDGSFDGSCMVALPSNALAPEPSAVRVAVTKLPDPPNVSLHLLPGHVLGGPSWIQGAERDTGFLLQLNRPFEKYGLNLGDAGSLYLFDDGEMIFQCL